MKLSRAYHLICLVVVISLSVMLPAYAATPSAYHLIKLKGYVFGINNNNVAVGEYLGSDQVAHGFIKTPDGTVTTLDAPNGIATYASGINLAGTVVGYYQDSATFIHGFIYQNGTLSDFGPPGSSQSFAYGINDAGKIVGTFLDTDGLWKGYLFDGTTYQTLQVSGASSTAAHGINNSGMVTVQWCCDLRENSHSSLFDGTNYTSIDIPGEATTYAYSIDSAGDVVFQALNFSGREHGALLTGGKYYRVEPPSGCHDDGAFGINDHRTIVGYCHVNNTQNVYYVTY